MQNYTNTKHPNSRKLQKEKHTQVAVTGGTALGGIKPNKQIIRKIQHKEQRGAQTLILPLLQSIRHVPVYQHNEKNSGLHINIAQQLTSNDGRSCPIRKQSVR